MRLPPVSFALDTMRDINIAQVTEQVKQLAKTTGDFIREQRKSFRAESVERKRPHDYVSYVDKQSERLITQRLMQIIPEAGFITEEQTVEQNTDGKEYCWVVDPLDGTTNFISDVPLYCVCIALKHWDEIIIGVVYEVTRDELFWAYKTGGAWLGEHPIRVSTNQFDDALIALGYPYNAKDFTRFAQNVTDKLYGNVASIRSLGSAEGELCYVASGRLDVYVESFLKPWDVAAGAIILQEAGGVITDYDNTDRLWKSGRQVLATNGIVHQKMIDIIKSIL